MRDDITSAERGAVYTLRAIAGADVVLARQISALPWVNDDITEIEREAIHLLLGMVYGDSALAQRTAALPWVVDDMTELEQWAVYALASIASGHPELARDLLDKLDDDSSGAELAGCIGKAFFDRIRAIWMSGLKAIVEDCETLVLGQ